MKTLVDTAFYDQVRGVIQDARRFVHATANVAMVKAYWLVGKMIVEKQGGAAKAAYGDGLVDSLSAKLTAEFGAGFARVNLFAMRKFYLAFPKVQPLCELLSGRNNLPCLVRRGRRTYGRQRNKIPPHYKKVVTACCRLADPTAHREAMDVSGFLPAAIRVGEHTIGPADFLFAGLDVLIDGAESVAVLPKEQLGRFKGTPLEPLEHRVRVKIPGNPRSGWMHTAAFRDEYTAPRLRWQLWTLRYE